MGQPLPFEALFVECDLYGSQSPWQLLNNNGQWLETVPGVDTVKCIYVFTTLKYLGKTGKKRMARTAGCGSWHMETGAKPVIDKETKFEIGKMEMFTFISNDQTKKDTKGHWIMHEFALSGSSLDYLRDESSKNYVVCKITRDDTKLLKVSSVSQIKKKARVEKESENNPPQRVHVDYGFATSLGSDSLRSMKAVTTTSLSSLPSSSSIYEVLDPFTKQKECLCPFGIEENVNQEASQHEGNNRDYIYEHEEGNGASETSQSMFDIEELLMFFEKDKKDGVQEMTMLQEHCALEIACLGDSKSMAGELIKRTPTSAETFKTKKGGQSSKVFKTKKHSVVSTSEVMGHN